jgi:cysteine desulfurase
VENAMFEPVYLDHNATTPLDPRVLAAMLPYLENRYGNASSRHEYGRAARRGVDEARQQVAAAVGAHPTEIIFTSGGSEANNLFLRGAAAMLKSGQIAVSAVEHPCVMRAAEDLARAGWKLSKLAVDKAGKVAPAALAAALTQAPAPGGSLVSVMLANNESGVIQDLAPLVELAHGRRAWFHTDAVQALGKIAVDFRALGVNAMTVSAHKSYGPKGAAALICDKRVELRAQIAGGSQERGLRAGTENVAAIVGFGAACEIATAELAVQGQRFAAMRDSIDAGVSALGATLFGVARDATRVPNTTFFAFPGIDGETLVGKLDRAGFAVASGAACSSGSTDPSPVLLAMGQEPELARGAVRVSLGRGNTAAQVEAFLATLVRVVDELKQMAAIAV